ncbi:hypothetical protein [Streptomyces sp. DH8]|uniref:hypothetical protein n=1 Tax=Streptomyces sp. DH8 TaxID=2857008 RepID=UPI001E3D5BFB|nr:hypothetical protein [Streptomyces sp. DH8]
MPAKILPTHIAAAITQEAAKHENNPLHQARVLGILASAGYSAREIAGFNGAPWDRIELRLALLDLVDEGKGAIGEGVLPVDLAGCVARLSEANQRLMLTRWLRGDFRSARHAERYALSIEADEQPQVSF